MDTILFFCRKKGLQEPEAEPIGMRTYLLIRVALDVGEEEWFGIRLGQDAAEKQGMTAQEHGAVCGSAKACGNAPEEMSGSPGRRHGVMGFLMRMLGNPAGEKRGAARGCAEKKRRTAEEHVQRNRGSVEECAEKKHGYVEERAEKECGSVGERAEKKHGYVEERAERKRGFSGERAEKKRRLAEEQERERLRAERQARIEKVEDALQKLASRLMEWAEEPGDCYCVYEESIRKALLGKQRGADAGQTEGLPFTKAVEQPAKQMLPAMWQKYFPLREFDGGIQQFWVEQLLPAAVCPHFVILGTASCLPAVLEKYVHRMKSLRWILCEADCTMELLDFVEDFYTEHGLAITLQPVPVGGQLRPMCAEPANILDFTQERRISLAETAKGSIWLDMQSMEEKKRRITGRSTGIAYQSLKELWKRAKRREPFIPSEKVLGFHYFPRQQSEGRCNPGS